MRSWIVFINFRRATRLLALSLMCFIVGGLCCAAVVSGVLVSDHIGEGRHPAGVVVLQTPAGDYTVEYTRPVAGQFEADGCWEPGARWVASIRRTPDGSWNLERAKCGGQFDSSLHKPWLVVQNYLTALADPKNAEFGPFSAAFRSSDAFSQFARQIKAIDLVGYNQLGRRGTCLDIRRTDTPMRVRIEAGADCYISVAGAPANMSFLVTYNPKTSQWEIDSIFID